MPAASLAGTRTPPAAVGAARPRLPPALRHPAGQPVRRRGVPGQPGRRRAVQPGAARPTRPAIAAGFAALLLPYSVVGPFAGVLLDRWRRQRVLVATNLVRCLAVGLVAIEIAAGATGALFYAHRAGGASRSTGSSWPRCRPSLPHVVEPGTTLVTGERAVHHERHGRRRGSAAASALGLRELVGGGNARLRADRAWLGRRLRCVGARRPRRLRPDPLGPDDVERASRETVGDVARGLVAGARHVGRAAPGRLRAVRHRRAPVLLRAVHDLRCCCSTGTTSPTTASSRPGWPGSARSSRRARLGVLARRRDHPDGGAPVRQAGLDRGGSSRSRR